VIKEKKKPYSQEDLETAFKAAKNRSTSGKSAGFAPRTTRWYRIWYRIADRYGTINGRLSELTVGEKTVH
jgi:hypothetical protein